MVHVIRCSWAGSYVVLDKPWDITHIQCNFSQQQKPQDDVIQLIKIPLEQLDVIDSRLVPIPKDGLASESNLVVDVEVK